MARPAEDFRATARNRVFAFILERRVWLLPLPTMLASLVAFYEPSVWRRAAILACFAFFVGVSIYEKVAFTLRRRLDVRAEPSVRFLPIGFTQAVLVFATGGLASPVVIVLPLATILSTMVAHQRESRMLVAVQLPALWLMAALHPFTRALDTPWFAPVNELQNWVNALAATLAIFSGRHLALRIRAAFDSAFDETGEARDESLRLHAERTRELTQLSAEIAHELKNPLASVKGLAQLLAKDLEGKPAQHLAVLRREVDRMQAVLDEFLNFSRPLVPLQLTDVDLRRLAEDVVALHEGVAEERGVTVRVLDGAEVHARCDARKVQQVLVNLVQNALDATPRGGRVDVELEPGDGSATLRVRDDGRGIDPELVARIFEPGVTGKAKGSGLGLTIARALARQHGGDLTLESRPSAGTVACVTLPAVAIDSLEEAA